MKIGIDIDGVLSDIARFIADYGIKFCVEENIKTNYKLDEYDTKNVFNWTDEQDEKFWNKYLKYYVTQYQARDFASEVIKKLRVENHQIYIITARNEYGLVGDDYGKMKTFVSEWLNKNNIEYDRIIYTEGSKQPYCVGNYIDLMIDDSPENIKEVSQSMPVFCFDAIYNTNVEGDNITRVYSWYDIYEKIKRFTNK